MSRAKPKVVRPHSPRPRQESRDSMKSRAEACRKVASRCCVAAQDAARACSRWNFSCTARFDTANPASAWTSKKPRRSWRPTSHRWVLICVTLPNARSCSWITFPLSGSEIAETGEYNLDGLFIRLAHAVKDDQSKARCPGQHRGAFCRRSRLNDTAVGTPPAVSLAGRPQAYRDRHRGSGRSHADPSRTGGIHRRLRHFAGPPGNGTDFHAAPAGRQVPGHFPRHRRVSVPDRSKTAYR